MNTIKKAALLVSVYDRPYHFKQCIESLKRNPDASKSDLYISSDGPSNDISNRAVKEVRDYIKSISGFAKVITFAPVENTNGEVRKLVWNEVVANNKMYIAAEDDNIFSKFALSYFNDALEIYKDDPDVHAVCGYIYQNFPSNGKKQLFLRCFTGWGIGLWSDKDDYHLINKKDLAKEAMSNNWLFAKINRLLPHLPEMTHEIVNDQLVAGDVDRCNYLIKNNRICVFPPKSLVRNIGWDGTGEHCGISDNYSSQELAAFRVEIDSSLDKKPLLLHESWVFEHFGGRVSWLHNWCIFFILKTKPKILQIVLLKIYIKVKRSIKVTLSSSRSAIKSMLTTCIFI